MASICSDHYIRIISLINKKDINTPIMSFHQPESSPNNICPLGPTTLLTSGYDRSVRLWDLR
jgi:WD40 repeat protein